MPDTAIAANLNKALDIEVNLFLKFTPNLILPVDKLTQAVNLVFGKAIRLGIIADAGLG
jgi:hypothetical protein